MQIEYDMGILNGHNVRFYFVLFLTLSFHQISVDAHPKMAMMTVGCLKTLHPHLCKAIVASIPGCKGPHLHGLFIAKAVLKQALIHGIATQARVAWLLKRTASADILARLHVCSQMYQDAIVGIKKSIAAMDSNGQVDVRNWLTTVVTNIKSCEDKCGQQIKSPVSDVQIKFSQLCSIGLAFATTAVEEISGKKLPAQALIPLETGGNSKPAPADGNSQTAPVDGNSKPAPADGNSQTAPVDGNSKPAPANGNSQTAPSDGNSQIGNSQRAPSDGNSQTAPSNGNSQTAPSDGNSQIRSSQTAPSNGKSQTTPYDGNSQTAPSDGNSQTAPSNGNSQTGNSQTALSDGNSQTTPSNGNSQTAPSDGNSQTAPTNGNSQTTPSDGNSQTAPSNGNSQTTPYDGNSRTAPSDGNSQTGNSKTAPSDGNSQTAPSNGNSQTAPSDENSQTGKSKAAPSNGTSQTVTPNAPQALATGGNSKSVPTDAPMAQSGAPTTSADSPNVENSNNVPVAASQASAPADATWSLVTEENSKQKPAQSPEASTTEENSKTPTGLVAKENSNNVPAAAAAPKAVENAKKTYADAPWSLVHEENSKTISAASPKVTASAPSSVVAGGNSEQVPSGDSGASKDLINQGDSGASKDLINQGCEKAKDKQLCKSTIQSFPESKQTDLQGLVKSILSHALTIGVEINEHVILMLKKTSNADLLARLKSCSQAFQDAITGIKKSIAALDSNGFVDCRTLLSSAIDSIKTCENTCGKDMKPKGFDMHTKFSQLCSFGLAFTAVLEEKSSNKIPAANGHQDFIIEGCARLVDKKLCTSIVKSFPGSNAAGSPQVLAKLALNFALKSTMAMNNHINILLKRTSDKNMLNHLNACAESCQHATIEIEHSIAALESNNFSFVAKTITSAINEVRECGGGFKQGMKTPLSVMKGKFSLLGDIGLSFTHMCQEKGH